MGLGDRTEIVGHTVHGTRHVCLGRLLLPPVLQVAVPPNDGEARAKRRVEPRRADDGVHLEHLTRLELDALGHEPLNLGPPDLHVGLGQGLQVAVAGRHPPGPEREVGDERLAELRVAPEHERHVFRDLGARKGLYGALCEDLVGC